METTCMNNMVTMINGIICHTETCLMHTPYITTLYCYVKSSRTVLLIVPNGGSFYGEIIVMF